ncbi:MAG: hypothetical protein ACR2NR_07340 [Solirubrobacteraceae bacterium]
MSNRAWVESVSASFRARHNSADADDAHTVLLSLERARDQLGQVFPHAPEGITVVLHGGPAGLALTNPLLPVTWMLTAPAARRYVAGWAGREDLHVLSPAALQARAANVSGSREMLQRTAACLYARRVIAENNPDLARVAGPIRTQRALRWAWLLEGSARWFGGQTEHARPAIARRLREGGRPSFPPRLRDAPLLGGTVIDLLVARSGERAAARFCCRLHPQGPRAALTRAFGGEGGWDFVHIEGAWRTHLARLAGAADA